jgi:hypothetical protein
MPLMGMQQRLYQPNPKKARRLRPETEAGWQPPQAGREVQPLTCASKRQTSVQDYVSPIFEKIFFESYLKKGLT